MDSGVKWRATPVEFPPRDREYVLFRRRRDHGLVKEFRDRLRGQSAKRWGTTRRRRPV
ncbi:hypothetical protein [Streptomyces sp. NPDC096132]|uniref:hypothetical protein n=1 Tax=Streptomyces sp. NPDC096132 TaxID=3366075 RepID=UPI00382AA03C